MKNFKIVMMVLVLALMVTITVNMGKAISEDKVDYKTTHVSTTQKDLGIECAYCHKMDDMKASTPMKELTQDMIVLTNKLRDEKGKAIDCAFCHNGKAKYLKAAKPENAK